MGSVKNLSTQSPISKLVKSILVTQIVIAVLCLIVVVSLGTFLPVFWAQLVTTLLGFYMHYAFIYSTAWSCGERDRNLVMYHHITEDLWKGLKAGLLSIIPFFVLTVLVILELYFHILPESYRFFYNLIGSSFILITVQLQENGLGVLLILLCALTPALTYIGYRHGYNLKYPANKWIYKTEGKKNYRSRKAKKGNEVPVNKPVTAAAVQRPGEQRVQVGAKTTIKKAPATDGERKLKSR